MLNKLKHFLPDPLFITYCVTLTVLHFIMGKLSCNTHKQTRHNFVGEIRIFSVNICINPYPSFMHRCRAYTIAKTFTRFISRCSLQKIATLCNIFRQPAAKNQNWSFTSRGTTVGLRHGLTILLHGRRNLPFFGNLSEIASCVDDKTVLFHYT